MENIKQNICDNLVKLRKDQKLTQKDLADKLNYSDKAISRWEKGESLPDISILIKICEFYGVEFEWLIHAHDVVPQRKKVAENNIKITIVSLIVMCCFALATIIFVLNNIFYHTVVWQAFTWAVPVSCTISFLFSMRWWSKKTSIILLSCAMWSLIICFFLYFLPGMNIWPVFLLGVPLQVIICLIYKLKQEKNS